ncbi:ABC transporter permease [Nakamurella lactea]|uniref:ABC transporter permease n=1 Tax=Nakamurella lactea TaxID=459515 RepID=UPI0003F56CB4|nr:ABC transporter permease [Nakamurella lactea]
MLRRFGIRALVFVVSAFGASVLIFFVLSILPGDPARVALGFGATDESVAALRTEMGLDRPLITQYLSWIGGVLHGDFGRSFSSKLPIGPMLFDRFTVTLWLVLGGVVVALIISIPLGVLAAVRHRKVSGILISGLSQVGVAVPAFLAGMLLIALVAMRWKWLPPNGYVVPATDPGGFVKHMILPWLSLGLVQGAVLTRYVRSAVLDEMGQDYLRTARSKGLRPMQALLRHGLRNASIPVVTVLGVQLVTLMIGAVVIERVFVIPGVGSMLTDAVSNRDLMTVQGIVFVLVLFALLVSFLVDIAYTLIDPRLRAK